MKPLAYTMRPKHFDEIVGQEHLVGQNGVLRLMINNKRYFSTILYGDPGIGKTTIAEALCAMSELPFYRFNASTDNKDKLKQIMNEARFNPDTFIIIDEIHRMKKDIQDFLLPYVENGTVIMLGLTTVNPYHSVNPAVRSRCHIFQLTNLDSNHLYEILKRAYNTMQVKVPIDDNVYQFIIGISGGEIRSLINNFELVVNSFPDLAITLDMATDIIQKGNIAIDKNQDNYFDTLSGLQKSIRGSDVNASVHYLAKLLVADDLQSICRRLLAIAYEDIGLANPSIGPKVVAVVNAARELGNPEARLPLASIVIEMALSPKSNSACAAIDAALSDLEQGRGGKLPLHLKNTYAHNPNQKEYLYPHDYPNCWVKQQYMPDELVNTTYYHPKSSSRIEQAFKERLEQIEQWKK